MLIFTNDDYRRIQAWLKKNAIKDSDFAISQETVPEEDILVITLNMATVPTNYKIKIKDLLNSSLGKIVIDSITAKSVKVNNVLTVDAANIKLDNEKGTTLLDVLNYFEENKLNRHTDDTFDGNLTIKKDLTIEGHIKSDDGLTTVEENFEVTGEITDGDGNMLSDVNAASKGWKIEYQDPQQDEPTVRAKYVLKDYKGVPKGNVIKVYKDSAITNVYLGTTEDTCNPDTGEVTKKPIHDNNEALSIVYRLDTGKYMLVNVPLGIFTREAEFDKYRGLGIEPNGQVFVKLASDVESTNYLHFNSLGEIAADGIEARILRDLGTLISSVAGDGTMWGQYKQEEGTQETSTPNDGSRWGEYKEAEAHRDALSNSNNIVYHEDWDDSEGPEWEDPVATEASTAYNWKTTDTPASDGKTQGNLKDLYQKSLDTDEKIAELSSRTDGISKEEIKTEEDSISIEDNKGNEVFHLDENGLDAKNVKSNGKEVLTEHQDISGLATKKDVEKKQDVIDEVSINTSPDDEEYQSWESDDENEEYARIDSNGVTAKDFSLAGGIKIGEYPILNNSYTPLVNVSGNSWLSGRPQNKLTAFKSFSPSLTNKGKIVAEQFKSDGTFDFNQGLLFDEKIACMCNVNNTQLSTWVGRDIHNLKQTISTDSVASDSWAKFNLWGLSSNKNGLLLAYTCYKYSSDADRKGYIMWSLDEGATFEVATMKTRAHFEVSPSDLVANSVVSIDDKEYSVVNAQSVSSVTYTEEQVNSTVFLTAIPQDGLRSLANILIRNGYKVLLKEESLSVCYKDKGTIGNGKTMNVCGNLYTFQGATDMSDAEAITYACIDYSDNPLTFTNGQSCHRCINEVTSMFEKDGKWYLYLTFTGIATDVGDVIAQLRIDDITNISTSSHSYTAIRKDNTLIHAEPLSTLCVDNSVIVSLRNQGSGQYVNYKSVDIGENWTEFYIPNSGLYIRQANMQVFLVADMSNQSLSYKSTAPTRYNRPTELQSKMYVALVYDRVMNVVYYCTAKYNSDITKVRWSLWNALNAYVGDGYHHGAENLGIYEADVSGNNSIGSFCYAPLHKQILVQMTGKDNRGSYNIYLKEIYV